MSSGLHKSAFPAAAGCPGIPVGHRGQDRPARREVLVRLARDDRRPAPAGRFCIGRNRRSARPHEGHDSACGRYPSMRTASRPSPPRGRLAAQNAGEVELDAPRQCWILRHEPFDGLEQVDVRAGQDVDARDRAAQQPRTAPPPLPWASRARCADIRCGRCGSRSSAAAERAGEVRGVEAVGDHDDQLGPELGKAPRRAARSLGGAHHDRGGGAAGARRIAAARAAMQRRRVHQHLVERPWVAEVGDPWEPISSRASRTPASAETYGCIQT